MRRYIANRYKHLFGSGIPRSYMWIKLHIRVGYMDDNGNIEYR